MKIEYSEAEDALYIYFRQVEVAKSIEPSGGIVVDLDDRGAIIGVEILDASTRFSPNDAAVVLKDRSDGSPAVSRILEKSLTELNVAFR